MNSHAEGTLRYINLLPPLERYLFNHYFDCIREQGWDLEDYCHKIGFVTVHTHLIRHSEALDFHSTLKHLPRQSFRSKALNMVSLATAAAKHGVKLSKAKDYAPPLSVSSVSDAFHNRSKNIAPRCPHVKASFEVDIHEDKSRPKKVKLSAFRFLLPSLTEFDDIHFSWKTVNNVRYSKLEISIQYPDLFNFPVGQVGLVTNQRGEAVFGVDHPAVRGFNEDIEERADSGDNGQYVSESFELYFDEEQDPKFVPIQGAQLSGFDLLRCEYENKNGEIVLESAAMGGCLMLMVIITPPHHT
eukprot:scaffold8090_cov82-Cylindrotheca_fusiformis.AAC.9